MTTQFKGVLLAAISVFAGLIPSHAAEAPARIALLIGNWDYNLNHHYEQTVDAKSGFERDLKKPCDDVDTVEGALAKAHFAKENVLKFCNLTKAEFDDKVAAAQKRLTNLPAHSVVFVYYAGHGMQYHGYSFLLPVKFNTGNNALVPQDGSHPDAGQNNLNFLRQNANELSRLFTRIADQTDAAVIFALDDCRNDPISEGGAYNEAVSIHPPRNAIVQYSTTPGDAVEDENGYAQTLSEEIGKGGELAAIVTRVDNRIYAKFAAQKRETYVDTNSGGGFASIKPISFDASKTLAVKEVSLLPVQRKKISIRPPNNVDTNFDILWCEGPGEDRRYAVAHEFAAKIAAKADDLKLGRVWLVPLSENDNANNGYGNVQRNLMRYDVTLDKDGKADPNTGERPLLQKIAQMFPAYQFLPRRGVGVKGRPTANYVSAFICGPQ